MFRPRPNQQKVLEYTNGKMGVSAVPGSGKTHTLAHLAAQIVSRDLLDEDQEVLIVTLVNSAVDNFESRMREISKRRGLLPHLGYRVRTLHGLSHDIVRERPGLVGLSDDFQIVDERDAEQILQDVVQAWVRSNPHACDDFFSLDMDEGRREWARSDAWPKAVRDIGYAFISQAKDLELTPVQLRDRLLASGQPLPLAEMGLALYSDYQRALAYRGAVDFADLIRLALQALRLDTELLERLRHRWPYILEDEAQDSSQLQEKILERLSGPDGNWVRVGDPNQAIYETFTTASPRYLRAFLQQPDVIARDLPDSGRSTLSIIRLANYLVDWTRQEHPVAGLRDALALPHIRPVPPGDPQPNPEDSPAQIHLVNRGFSPAEEVQAVVDSVARWLSEHPDETVAVLAPRNDRGFAVSAALKQRGIEYVEMLRSTRSTRETAGALGNVLTYLADPTSATKLATVYRVWRRDERSDEEAAGSIDAVARTLRKCSKVEDFLWPRLGKDWLDDLEALDGLPAPREHLEEFRRLVCRWHEASILPIDQLLLTLAQDLFTEAVDLTLAHKLALLLRNAADAHPAWRLPELVQELAVIAHNERRFIGLSADDIGFNPDDHRGKVLVATVHKAKGLEWDRVYLMSVNNYDFPSALPHDQFIAEKWFVRDSLNLQEEALAQLEALERVGGNYQEGAATEEARLAYAAERLRLLYVGITRARKELVITWNTGRRGDQQPAVPLIALQEFWKERIDGAAE